MSAPAVVLCRGGAGAVWPVEALAALERRSFSDPWSPLSFEQLSRMPQARLFTLTEEAPDAAQALVGFALLLSLPPEGELLNLAVAPEKRRQGKGKALMAALLAACREEKIADLYLEVRASNNAARALYGKWGFAEVGRRCGYYANPREDALVMRLDLI